TSSSEPPAAGLRESPPNEGVHKKSPGRPRSEAPRRGEDSAPGSGGEPGVAHQYPAAARRVRWYTAQRARRIRIVIATPAPTRAQRAPSSSRHAASNAAQAGRERA